MTLLKFVGAFQIDRPPPPPPPQPPPVSTTLPTTMKQKTWPYKSGSHQFTSLPFINKPYKKSTKDPQTRQLNFTSKSSSSSSSSFSSSSKCKEPDFSSLPYDVLARIASSFSLTNLQSASLVCRAWRDGLRPLREAMLFLKWGKRFKHGRGGVKSNLKKALDSFLKGAARGSTMAMVDAGLIYWEMGKKEEGIAWYRKAAELGNPAGQCNLGISYLQADPSNAKEAIDWLYQASVAGNVRAQYQLALCWHQGRGLPKNLQEAARWYLRAAEGGYVRAMYNTSLCYSSGQGLVQSHSLARKWMKKAADHGHSKAQYEHGLGFFSGGEMMKAVVYLELATRAGENAAAHVKDVILQQLSATSRDRAMHMADNWRALPSTR